MLTEFEPLRGLRLEDEDDELNGVEDEEELEDEEEPEDLENDDEDSYE